MATPLASPEIGIRAAIDTKDRAPALVIGSAEEKAYSTIKKGIEENTPPSKIVDSLTAPIDKRRVEGAIEANIGWERNVDGSKRLSLSEQARADEIKKHQDNIRDLREKGYDGLTDVQKDSLALQTEQVLSEVPQIKDWLDTLSPGVKRQICEDLIRDPQFAVRLDARNAKVLGRVVEDSIRTRREAFDDKRELEKALKDQLADATREWGEVQTALEDYKIGGVKQVELQALVSKMPALSRDLQDQREIVEGITDEISVLRAARARALINGRDTASVESEIATKTAELKTQKMEQQRIDNQIARKLELEQEKQALSERQRALGEQRATIDESYRLSRRDRLAAQTELSLAKNGKAEAEDDYVADHRNCFKDAMRDLLTERMNGMEGSRLAALETEKVNTVDSGEKFLLDQLQGRYFKMENKGVFNTKEVKVVNKDQVGADWDILMKYGPEKLMEKILSTHGTPLTATEITAKLNDPKFVEKNLSRTVEAIISKRVQTSMLTEGEVRAIVDAPWGAGMIDKAIASRNEISSVMKKLNDEHVYSGSFGEWMKRKSNGSVLKMMLLIFGTAFLGAVPLYKAAKDAI